METKKSKHTPGPWESKLSHGTGRVIVEGKQKNGYWRKRAVADFGVASGETNANALLASAAPDMLAALVALLESRDHAEILESSHEGQARKAARAAIAKAKGA